MYGEPHMQHSCEVYRKGVNLRRIFYGRTRDEILADRDLLARVYFGPFEPYDPANWQRQHPEWQDWIVVLQRSTALGLGSQWTRVTRRRDEYGEIAR